MFSDKDTLAKVDPKIWQVIENENRRQEEHIELIMVAASTSMSPSNWRSIA